jgi:hypothetical protein
MDLLRRLERLPMSRVQLRLLFAGGGWATPSTRWTAR